MSRTLNNLQQLFERAAKYQQAGELACAEKVYLQLLQHSPQHLAACNNLGTIYKDQANYEEATRWFLQALSVNPDFAAAQYNLGNVLVLQKRTTEALPHLQAAHRLEPDQVRICYALGNVWKDLSSLTEAAECYHKTLALNPQHAEAYNNLALVVMKEGRYDEAESYLLKALELNFHYAGVYHNLATVYYYQGRFEQAMMYSQKALQLNPDYEEARFFQGSMLLRKGDYETGFSLYESRFYEEKNRPEDWDCKFFPTIKRWQGEHFSGKRLLVIAEQAYGDSLQFVRYLAQVKERGGHVTLSTWPLLLRLFRSLRGVDEFVEHTEQEVCIKQFDLAIPLMSLPLVFGTTLKTVPSKVPYLHAEASLVKRWQTKLTNIAGYKIGLVWSGSPDNIDGLNRTCGLKALAPLAGVEDVTYVSLQKGEPAQEVANLQHGLPLLDFTEDIHNFADTAALIANLDIVITIDTSVAHLAGALAKPVWIMLPFDSEWRWLMDREDSPWYPTARLFRQQSRNDWKSVMAQLVPALKEWTAFDQKAR